MGGSTENDNAMRWFLNRADGGDVLVLRTSGSDGYNSYMYSGLGVNVNSVETIVCHSREASWNEYLRERIKKAEAIWFAGGNQWNYISYWRNTPVDSLINSRLKNKNIVIGGTSAGMAILGGFYFSAENGTVKSSTALNDPYDSTVSIDSSSFIIHHYLSDVITDTHYDNPDRKGRHTVFLARILQDYGTGAKGIACDEHTAVCIDTNGIANVYGQYPEYNDNAWFIQTNCELNEVKPENCSPGTPLTWDRGNMAIKACRIRSYEDGSGSFDLNNWETATGGSWFDWYVSNGIFHEKTGTPINCSATVLIEEREDKQALLYPNPANTHLRISPGISAKEIQRIELYNSTGNLVLSITPGKFCHGDIIDVSNFPKGIYFVRLTVKGTAGKSSKLIIN